MLLDAGSCATSCIPLPQTYHPCVDTRCCLLQSHPSRYSVDLYCYCCPVRGVLSTAADALAMASSADKGPSKEMQAFLEREQQLAQVQQMIASLTEVCFEKCISSPGTYLSSRETNCIENCAKRFIDTTQFILQRAAHKAESGGVSGF